jgi:hypothetical protein
MRGSQAGLALVLAILFVVPAVRPQPAPQDSKAAFGNPFDNPLIRKYWNPVVGAGAVHEVTQVEGRKTTTEYDILSQETVDGKKAYWVEFSLASPDFKGKIYGKELIIPEGYQARKLIIQFPAMAAMEMPVTAEAQNAETKENAKLVGTESITVPGGTFECEHLRSPNGSEAWANAKVAPLKIVKSVDKNETWVLVRTITTVKDAITGPVKDYDPEAIKRFAEKQSKSPGR